MNIINLGVYAHVDAGKTTTVEKLLYISGTTRKPGSVNDGTAATDRLEVERARGISVQSASAVISLPDLRLNIIDTPGHMDFAAEVQRSLLAADCGLLIVSAAEGVQSQTELFFKSMSDSNIPMIIFVNKIDRAGVDALKTLAELKRKLSGSIFPLNQVITQGSRECSVRDRDLDEDEILSLCAMDKPLEDQFLNGSEISREQAADGLFRQCHNGTAYPLVFGSAACDIGIEELFKAVKRLPSVIMTDGLNQVTAGRIFKLEHDKAMGKAAHVRLFSGFIKNRDTVTLSDMSGEPRTDKVSQIKRFSSGSRLDACGELTAGDIAIIYGLSQAKVGDIIGEIQAVRSSSPLSVTPLFNVKITDDNPNPTPLLTAVRELSDEDPLLSCEWVPDERELTVNIMGQIQIEVLKHLLKERYGINAEFSSPTVIYKETVKQSGIGFESYTMPKPCWAVVELTMEPLPPGRGYVFDSIVKGEQIPYKYQSHIKTALINSMKQGLYGWEVVDLKITLTGGEWHHIHTHPMDFFLAAPIAFMNGLTSCGPELLEPFIMVNIAAAQELSGKIIGDIIAMRGDFGNPEIIGGNVEIEACLPLSEAMDYPARLSSLSSGKARYSQKFDGFRPCPLELGMTAKRRGVNPLDRAKWILHMRQAL